MPGVDIMLVMTRINQGGGHGEDRNPDAVARAVSRLIPREIQAHDTREASAGMLGERRTSLTRRSESAQRTRSLSQVLETGR